MMFSIGMLSVAGACGGDSVNNGNLLVQDLATLVGAEVLNLNLNSCATLGSSLQDLVGQDPCDQGGSITISIVNQNCNDGPPLNATNTLNFIFDGCITEDGNVYNGNLAVQGTLNPSSQSFQLASPSFSGNGEVFSFSNFTQTYTGSFPVCAGSLNSSSGTTCQITADCSACN